MQRVAAITPYHHTLLHVPPGKTHSMQQTFFPSAISLDELGIKPAKFMVETRSAVRR